MTGRAVLMDRILHGLGIHVESPESENLLTF